jgi:hypothetical protein
VFDEYKVCVFDVHRQNWSESDSWEGNFVLDLREARILSGGQKRSVFDRIPPKDPKLHF